MLSYRHAFHAGNHADVLKHFVQVQLHLYMNQKDAAYTYIDTHSGAGVYALDSFQATKTAEFDTGIGPLWNCSDVPAPLKEYLDLIKGMNPSGKMRYYPGSPWVAEQMSREQDRLRLFELHPADCKILAENFRKLDAHKAEQGERSRGRRVIIERGDGFNSLKALLPPPSRRALVLIDPPYEVKDDYRKVKDALEEALGLDSVGRADDGDGAVENVGQEALGGGLVIGDQVGLGDGGVVAERGPQDLVGMGDAHPRDDQLAGLGGGR